MIINGEKDMESKSIDKEITGENSFFGKRLDIITADKGLAPTRSKAKELILSGRISVNGRACLKPATLVSEKDEIVSAGALYPYVSRGGVKLEWALKAFNVDLNGLVCLDVGASTGGFTHCMLLNGASHVYAVDVGHSQLAEIIRGDNRVTSLEGINMKTVDIEDKEIFPNLVDFVSIDVSFISLVHILLNSSRLLKDSGTLVALIKPQFEAGADAIGRDGVVKSKKLHEQIINKILLFAGEFMYVEDIAKSPILGGNGNQEYLMYCRVFADGTKGINEKIIKSSLIRHIIYN